MKITNQNSAKSELIENLINVRRVVRVIKGGRIFSFSALVVVGDGKGHVGYAIGKSRETSQAIQKAINKAKLNMVRVPLHKDTICYPVRAGGTTKIHMRPAKEGSGLIAGGTMRAVFQAVGIKNISSKCLGSKNSINVVRDTVKILSSMSSPVEIAKKRGKTVSEILN